MIHEYYENQFLNPDKERYANDIDLYEREILAQQNESFYTPAGYRAIQQILIEYPDEVNKGLTSEKLQFNTAAQAVADALQPLAEAAATAQEWDDISEACENYARAAKALEEIQKAIIEKREALTAPLVRARVDEIRTAFNAGIDFTSLIKKYSADTNAQNTEKGGYPVHPDSRNWPAEFLQAASALEKPGDISEPILTDLGVHILYYASDIPEGAHELTGEERKTLNASALEYYQTQELEALMADWRNEYDIETHPELLDD
jgi:parvulin-like peptidyl-prolyl isomerase